MCTAADAGAVLVAKIANDEANSVLNVDMAGERKMLEARKDGEASKVILTSCSCYRW